MRIIGHQLFALRGRTPTAANGASSARDSSSRLARRHVDILKGVSQLDRNPHTFTQLGSQTADLGGAAGQDDFFQVRRPCLSS